jgi:redox-sensitive bicupin YhaK (pirin superfamily)
MKKVQQVRRQVPPHWVGDGVLVRSLVAYDLGELVSPFLLLDYGAPREFPPGGGARRGVGEHPHRGFETVTVVYQGELEHRDSGGNSGSIGPGDVQWMTAASGTVHEEFHSTAFSRKGGTVEMAQLWVNLPAKDKMSSPRYQEITAASIPEVSLAGGAGSARVVAGELEGRRGPAETFTPLNVLDLRLQGGPVEFSVPDGHTALLAVFHGAVLLDGDERAGDSELVIFERQGADVRVDAQGETVALLLTGEPIEEPVVGYGPFVMNDQAGIRKAIADFQSGAMGRLD